MARLCLNLLNLSERYDSGIPLEDQLDAAADAGAELVGLDASAVKRGARDAGGIEAFAAELSRRGLRCYELTYLECDPAKSDATLADAERLAGFAGELGAEYILTSSGLPVCDELARIFARCCDAAREHGTGLAYEFFPWAPIDHFEAAHALVRRAGRDNAGVLLDCWHFFHGPDDWAQLEALSLEAIAYVQFTDSAAVAPVDYREQAQTCRRMPGEGILALGRFAGTLVRRGFDGVVSVEVLSPETRALGARAFARRCLETARPYWESDGESDGGSPGDSGARAQT